MSAKRTIAILGAAALVLLSGAGAWFILSRGEASPPVSTFEMVDNLYDEIALIGATLTDGRIFYYKTENFRADCLEELSSDQCLKDAVYQRWIKVGLGGRVSKSVTAMKSAEGDLLQYAVGNGSTITHTVVASGEVFEFDVASGAMTLDDWLQAIVARPQELLQEDDYEFVGRGTMGGKVSVIFRQVPAGAQLEFVEADPLLNRVTHYAGIDVVSKSVEVVEYAVLDVGASMPTFP